MKRAFSLGLGVFFLLLACSQVFGQGVLIVVDPPYPVPLPRPYPWWIPPPRPPRPPVPPPEPPASYKIKELSLQARIVDQVARVQVSQSFVNTGSRQMEVSFVFPLPYDGAVDQLTFMVDGKEIPAKLLRAAEARSIYEGYVRRNQDPALLEWIGTGMFKTSVFPVPPGAERKVNLRYNQLLRKDRHVTDFLFPLSTAKYTSAPVERVLLEASIESAIAIKSVYSPIAHDRCQAVGRPACHDQIRGSEPGPGDRFPPVLRRGSRRGRGQRVELPTRGGGRRLLPAAGQPADQGGFCRAPAQDDDLRGGPVWQHERQEDGAGQGGPEVCAEQSPPGGHVQHHRL